MKGHYPDYRKNVDTENVYASMSDSDKQTLNDFLDYCRVSCSEIRARMLRRNLIQIYDIFEMPFDKIDYKSLIHFLKILNLSSRSPANKNDIKKTLKRFLKWRFKDWAVRFESLKFIKLDREENSKKLNPNVLLTPEDIEGLIRSADSLSRKALVILLFETGGRPEEILKLKWKDINFERARVSIFSSKTNRHRLVPVKKSLLHLKRYRQEYPFPSVTENDYIFPSPRNRLKHITVQALHNYIQNLGKIAIGRNIFPYLFRHTRLSPLIQTLSPKAYESFAGHSIETAKKYYSHLSVDQLHQEIIEKVYDVKEITEVENKKIKELEDRIVTLENTIHHIIDKANLAFNQIQR